MSDEHAAIDDARSWRKLWPLVAVAFALRIAFVAWLDSPRAAAAHDAWNWGHEAACLAKSLIDTEFYGDPWGKGTGPSAWLTPPYPFLVSLVMRIGGGVTRESAWILFAIQSLASAITCALIVRLGAALARPRIGWIAGWIFCFYPPSIWNAVDTVWDTTLVAFGVVGFALSFLGALRVDRARTWIAAGLAFGALVFLNPAPASLALAIGAAIFVARGELRSRFGAFALLCVSALAVCAPWMVRNALVIGNPSLRPNLGVELRLGNNATSTGRPVPMLYHPSHVPEELALYRELGEKGYSANCLGRALDWIRSDPARFAVLTLRRIQFFWLGDPPTIDARTDNGVEARADWKAWIKFLAFGLAGALALVALFRIDLEKKHKVFLALAVLAWGLPYFVTHVSERYRFPIDPLIIWLDAWMLCRWIGREK